MNCARLEAHPCGGRVGERNRLHIQPNWRMCTAGRLLRETYLKLGAFADRVGCESEFAFAKAFKRAYDIAPGAYRIQPPG